MNLDILCLDVAFSGHLVVQLRHLGVLCNQVGISGLENVSEYFVNSILHLLAYLKGLNLSKALVMFFPFPEA